MSRLFKANRQTIRQTVVPYRRDGSSTVYQATFNGNLSDSEIERQMLFHKNCPRRNIIWNDIEVD